MTNSVDLDMDHCLQRRGIFAFGHIGIQWDMYVKERCLTVLQLALYGGVDCPSERLGGKFHPRYLPVAFAGIYQSGKYSSSGKYWQIPAN